MGLTSLQVCMDSPDWLLQVQGTMENESGLMDPSSLSPSSGGGGDMLLAAAACSRLQPAAGSMERRLRPPQDQALKCPRCESTHTKFCYYNNYSLTQPRYFCKTCRRYWTKGGTLRNIPVGGGCRKSSSSSSSKKSSVKNKSIIISSSASSSVTSSPTSSSSLPLHHHQYYNYNGELINSLLGNMMLLERPPPPDHHDHHDFMERKLEGLGSGGLGGHHFNNHDFMIGNDNLINHHHHHHAIHNVNTNTHGLMMSSSRFGIDGPAAEVGMPNFMESYQRLMLPYDHDDDHGRYNVDDVKPNSGKLLSLDVAKESGFGYLNGLGSWNNCDGTTTSTSTSASASASVALMNHHPMLMNSYGSTSTSTSLLHTD